MNEPKRLISFTPVPIHARHDGWTADKQIAFIEALAETGVVEEACRPDGWPSCPHARHCEHS